MEEFADKGEVERIVGEGEIPYVTFTELDGGAFSEEVLVIEANKKVRRMFDESGIYVDTLDVNAEIGGEFESENSEAAADIED